MYLSEGQIQKKIYIYSNKFFHNFQLSESSFNCPELPASGLARRLTSSFKHVHIFFVMRCTIHSFVKNIIYKNKKNKNKNIYIIYMYMYNYRKKGNVHVAPYDKKPYTLTPVFSHHLFQANKITCVSANNLEKKQLGRQYFIFFFLLNTGLGFDLTVLFKNGNKMFRVGTKNEGLQNEQKDNPLFTTVSIHVYNHLFTVSI